jgi:hypothetical protein
MRERINKAAANQPLGSLKTSHDVTIGATPVPAGDYALAFTLDDGGRWQMSLTSAAGRRDVALALAAAPSPSKRLVLSLHAGDADFTAALSVAFGNQSGRVAVVPGAVQNAPAPIPVGKPEQTTKAAPGAQPAGDMINAKCPLMDEPVVAKFAVVHKGHKIGLCCEECVPEWNKLPAAEKDAYLAVLLKGR